MNNERIREFCLSLPHVRETVNWGHNLVFWVGDRNAGGKMFAIIDLEANGRVVLSYHCGAERFHELLEVEGIRGAPHLARIFWVAVERWDVLRPLQFEEELRLAHALIHAKLPRRVQAELALEKKPKPKAKPRPMP
jgi:predicted DNA-binding protein (MmcQ/YjbR family)